MKPWLEKTDAENRFTSTGAKFWRHRAQMEAYRIGTGRTVVSTHVAPEGACNLKCPYCSVTHRDTHNRISLDVIKDYIEKLATRGLKAVIITGGGEPTIYKHINELIAWVYEAGLKVALITNGTQTHRLERDAWKMFSWVRVSINFFEGWRDSIRLPVDLIPESTTIGCSLVYTPKHEIGPPQDWLERLRDVSRVADACRAEYIRILPDCLLDQPKLAAQHAALDCLIRMARDPRLFRQDKHHRAPSCGVCHQSYFRPYLSEATFGSTGKPGSVYPCDSVVLNDARAKFTTEYQLCAPHEILEYLDGKIRQRFDPRDACSGCVFTDSVEMLGSWKNEGVGEFIAEPMKHEEFV